MLTTIMPTLACAQEFDAVQSGSEHIPKSPGLQWLIKPPRNWSKTNDSPMAVISTGSYLALQVRTCTLAAGWHGR